MTNRMIPVVAIAAVVAGLIAVAYSGGSRRERAPAENAAATAPGPRIEVPAVTLPRADGGTFSSAALRGKSPLVLSFFATWCAPCREELPHLIDLYQKHRAEGLQVVGITTEDAATAQQFARDAKIPYPILVDADAVVFRQFQADSIPLTVVLDKRGRAAGSSPGYSPDQFDQIETLAVQLAKE